MSLKHKVGKFTVLKSAIDEAPNEDRKIMTPTQALKFPHGTKFRDMYSGEVYRSCKTPYAPNSFEIESIPGTFYSAKGLKKLGIRFIKED